MYTNKNSILEIDLSKQEYFTDIFDWFGDATTELVPLSEIAIKTVLTI